MFKSQKPPFVIISNVLTGIELTFFSGVYGTCISNTPQFGDNAKGLIGISGMFIGVGEILGKLLKQEQWFKKYWQKNKMFICSMVLCYKTTGYSFLRKYFFHEWLGGAAFGLMGKRTNKYGRDPIVLLGYLAHMAAFFLIFMNIPNGSPQNNDDSATYMTPR